MNLSPTTEIEAINTMLTIIGEQPIQNVEDLAGLQDASIAKQILDSVSRAVQSRGWIFNTDKSVTLTANSSGEIILQSHILRVDTTDRLRNSTSDIIERGRKLYDRIKNTANFGSGAKVVVDTVRLLRFADLPEPARRYVTLRAGRMFHDRVVGSGTLHQFYAIDEAEALRDLQHYEADVSDYNIFDNYDVSRVLDRWPSTQIMGI